MCVRYNKIEASYWDYFSEIDKKHTHNHEKKQEKAKITLFWNLKEKWNWFYSGVIPAASAVNKST